MEPLVRRGDDIRFWSHENEEIGSELLNRAGLEEFQSSAIFDRETRTYLGSLRGERVSGLRYSKLRFYPNQLEIPQDLDERESRWVKVADELQLGSFKHIPMLGDGLLLVESDTAMNNEWYSSLRRSISKSEHLEAAKEDGYSMILTPEHPDVWLEPHGITDISAEQVVEELRKKLLGWDGNQIISDLGQEMGIYERRV